jgi:[ribosomal protein S18]-alanine N-acetyltransferase
MTAAPTIRPVGPFDLALVAALHAACFADGWTAAAIGALLAAPGAFGLLAVEGDEPAGFILVRPAADEAEILAIGVHAGARRRGLGRALLAAAMARLAAAGTRRLLLEVAEDNPAALRLYERAGFVPVGRRPGYYRERGTVTAALIMARSLDAVTS